MPRFTGTDLPSLKLSEDSLAAKKAILDLLDKINTVADSQFPVGYTYTQYPNTAAPATLFGGTWTDITSTAARGQDKLGYIYVQYPNQADPVTQFGGTWLNVSSLYAGAFFRAEGGSANSFNTTVQTDAFQGHKTNGNLFSNYATAVYTDQIGGGSQTAQTWLPVTSAGLFDGLLHTQTTLASFANPWQVTGSVITDGTNGTPRTASETRPTNWTVRVWSRLTYTNIIWQKTGGSTNLATTSTIAPAGIYDSGTNANGSWIRFTDGTMQVWWTDSSLSTTASATGALFFVQKTITFPQQFISPPTVTFAGQGQSAIVFGSVNNTGLSTTGASLSMVSVVNTGTGTFAYTATGKWK